MFASNNVEATFDFVEKTKFQRKTRSTLLPFGICLQCLCHKRALPVGELLMMKRSAFCRRWQVERLNVENASVDKVTVSGGSRMNDRAKSSTVLPPWKSVSVSP